MRTYSPSRIIRMGCLVSSGGDVTIVDVLHCTLEDQDDLLNTLVQGMVLGYSDAIYLLWALVSFCSAPSCRDPLCPRLTNLFSMHACSIVTTRLRTCTAPRMKPAHCSSGLSLRMMSRNSKSASSCARRGCPSFRRDAVQVTAAEAGR